MWKQGVAAVVLLFVGGAGGFAAGAMLSPAHYSAVNVGHGNVIRMNNRTGETALFNADCLAKTPEPPKGYSLDSCP